MNKIDLKKEILDETNAKSMYAHIYNYMYKQLKISTFTVQQFNLLKKL